MNFTSGKLVGTRQNLFQKSVDWWVESGTEGDFDEHAVRLKK